MSKTPEWETPLHLFYDLNAEFDLNVDVCATKENSKKPIYWDKQIDGLAQNWKKKRCWMNPPYGREIGKWIEKAATGGGKNCGGTSSCTHGHSLVSRLYLSETECRDTLSQRSFEIRRIKKLCPVS